MAHSKIELKIKCNNLPNLDYCSKSDPRVYLLLGDSIKKEFDDNKIKGYTEIIKDCLNPEFVTGFTLDYNFELLQLVRFIVVDVDEHNDESWRNQEYIGRFDCSLAQIVSSPNQILTGDLYNEKKGLKKGTITILCEELKECKNNIRIQFSAINLPVKKSFLGGKSFPRTFITIAKFREDLRWVTVYKSSVKEKVQNPRWDTLELSLTTLCNGDLYRELKFDIVKLSSSGDETVLSSIRTSISSIFSSFMESQNLILNESGLDKDAPKLVINEFRMVPGPPSFLDYIRSGIQISFTMAIDFTQSNGMPNNPSSLHYLDPQGRFNQYQLAIKSVGDIIAPYDHDQMFPVYGFGGRVNGVVSHCFPLNSNYNQPEVYGVDNILKSYHDSVKNIELYGPTNFSPIINQTINKVNGLDKYKNYEILVILTDGVITDMELTIEAIIKASHLPMSIIIIGVGNADFEMMQVLDGDKKRLSHNGRSAVRDIVQFVPMNEFSSGVTQYLLPKAVLEEIPDQLKSFQILNK